MPFRNAVRFRSFARDQRGNVAMIFAACALPFAIVVGASLDLSRQSTAGIEVQNALDAAALAAARAQWEPGATDAGLRQIAQDFFGANLTGNASAATCTALNLTRTPATGEVDVDVDCEVPTTMTALLGVDSMPVSAQSSVVFNILDVDLALMLDITGSMSGSKIAALKVAANDLIDTLLGPNDLLGEVRIALAPYATSINVGSTYFEAITNQPLGGATCATERSGGTAYEADAPGPLKWLGTASTSCPGASIMPLSDNATTLKAQINAYNAGGWTAGHLGAAFARYLIAPEWAGVWPSGSAPKAYNDPKVLKAVILMTDGEFNTQYSGLGSSSAQAINQCDAMKDDGVIVYSVAFQAPAAAETTLRNCASSPSTFFDAADADELIAAYQSIADSITALRLTH